MGIQIARGSSAHASASDIGASSESAKAGPATISFAEVMADLAVASLGQRNTASDHHDEKSERRHDHEQPSDTGKTIALDLSGNKVLNSTAPGEAAALNTGIVSITNDVAHSPRSNPFTVQGVNAASFERPRVDIATTKTSDTSVPAEEAAGEHDSAEITSAADIASVLRQFSTMPADATRHEHYLSVLERLGATPRTAQGNDRGRTSTTTSAMSRPITPTRPTISVQPIRIDPTVLGSSATASQLGSPAHSSARALGARHQSGALEHAPATETAGTDTLSEASLDGTQEFVSANGELMAALSRPLAEGNGAYSLRVQIRPPELGAVDATVRVHGDTVDVQLAASTSAGHLAISNHLEAIRQALATDGREVHIRISSEGERGEQRDASQDHTGQDNEDTSGDEHNARSRDSRVL